MAESTDNEQDINSAPTDEQPQQPFITLPFDEEISFTSPQELLKWIKRDKGLFDSFRANSLPDRNDSGGAEKGIEFPDDIVRLIEFYEIWYYRALEISKDICELHLYSTTPSTLGALNEKKEDLIRYWTDFTNEGLVPMHSHIGRCAGIMSFVKEDEPKSSPPPFFLNTTLGMAWLLAMASLRKQQIRQKITTARVAEEILKSSTALGALNNDIQEAQRNVAKYKDELELFQKDALKSAALKSPANSLGKLERGHLKAAGGWFALASVITLAWATFIIQYYFPNVVVDLLDKKGQAPFETGAMVLTSVVLTGIVLTSVIILLRLAVSRINFSVAAGERKALATAYRALLIQNAIPDAQQMLFLQKIVGSKLPDFVNCNDIRIPVDELTKLVQTILKEKKE